MKTPLSNLNRTGAVNCYMPILLALIAFSNSANLEYFLFETFVSVIYFGILVLNIIPEWGWQGTKLMRLRRWRSRFL